MIWVVYNRDGYPVWWTATLVQALECSMLAACTTRTDEYAVDCAPAHRAMEPDPLAQAMLNATRGLDQRSAG